MSRFTIVLDPEDYNDRLVRATGSHAVGATWLLIALAALALLSFELLAEDADATACVQRVMAPNSHALERDGSGERTDRLDWDREDYERGVATGPRTMAQPCSS
jgi:hypothetical protein